MNEDTIKWIGQGIAGKVKQTAGDISGDGLLRAEGVEDQLTGQARKLVGSLKDLLNGEVAGRPTLDRKKQFACAKPIATGAAFGVVSIALLNTLRGRTA